MTVSKSGASLLLTTWERHGHTVISVMVGLRSENTHSTSRASHTPGPFEEEGKGENYLYGIFVCILVDRVVKVNSE